MPVLRCKAMRTFSSTLKCGKVAEIWNERTMPRRATWAGFSAVMSWPLNKMEPRVGIRNLVRRLKNVVFGPVGSDQGVDLASANANGDVIDGHKALELFDEPTCFQNDVISHGYL